MEAPLFSIIVPTYERPLAVERCLHALAEQDYPAEQFEIIVVDDGSPHSLKSLIAKFRPQVNICLIEKENAGPASARNQGAAHARGRFLAFTDDDCQPNIAWLAMLAEAVVEQPNVLVGGYTHNALDDNLFAEASQSLIDALYTYYVDSSGQPRFFTSNNMALSAEMFAQLGGFDTTFNLAAGEDRDFCNRWRQAGWTVQYLPRAIVNHYHDLSPRAFWQQHTRYGIGAYRLYEKRTKTAQKSLQFEPPRFYFSLILYPLRQTGFRLRNLQLVALLFITQLANLLGFLQERQVR